LNSSILEHNITSADLKKHIFLGSPRGVSFVESIFGFSIWFTAKIESRALISALFLLLDILNEQFIMLLLNQISLDLLNVDQLNKFAAADERYFYQLVEDVLVHCIVLIDPIVKTVEIVMTTKWLQLGWPSFQFKMLPFLVISVKIG
jgi:hypothetical protein